MRFIQQHDPTLSFSPQKRMADRISGPAASRARTTSPPRASAAVADAGAAPPSSTAAAAAAAAGAAAGGRRGGEGEQAGADRRYVLKAACFEIYNEQVAESTGTC